nr:MAG TPA: hypothetical protein [Caudoviricetes sp.]
MTTATMWQQLQKPFLRVASIMLPTPYRGMTWSKLPTPSRFA